MTLPLMYPVTQLDLVLACGFIGIILERVTKTIVLELRKLKRGSAEPDWEKKG